MIRYKICWVHDVYEDSIIIEGESIEEIQEKAAKIIEARKPDEYWSEPA
jgi:ribosomal protein L6P/L9E